MNIMTITFFPSSILILPCQQIILVLLGVGKSRQRLFVIGLDVSRLQQHHGTAMYLRLISCFLVGPINLLIRAILFGDFFLSFVSLSGFDIFVGLHGQIIKFDNLRFLG